MKSSAVFLVAAIVVAMAVLALFQTKPDTFRWLSAALNFTAPAKW